MNPGIYLSLLIMCLTVYCIRMLPFLVFRKEITNRWLRSFLYYVPYVTLAVMTFPSILSSTGSTLSAWIGFIAALYLAWRGKGLLPVACVACGAVFAAEVLTQFLG